MEMFEKSRKLMKEFLQVLGNVLGTKLRISGDVREDRCELVVTIGLPGCLHEQLEP